MFFRDKKVLVTGSTGLVGSNLIEKLLEQGAIVRATLHKKESVIVDSRIEYIKVDLTQKEDCQRVVEGRDFVFMCAANTSGAATIASTPMVHVTPNVLMNSQMLEASYDAGVQKFLWMSSTTGYPPSEDRCVKEEEMFDGEPFEKYFFVGWMKRFTEILCQMYGEKLDKPMTTIVLRPTNIYGINDDFEFATSHVVPALIRKVVERWDPIEVWGTGEDIRDVIYVEDMVESMLKAMEEIQSYTAINIGLGKGYSVKQILQTILEIDGYSDAKVEFNSAKPTMIPVRLINTTKAENILGFRAKTDLREGLKKTIQWYRENYK
ncbi:MULTISPECIES: NAD-dependent epimerase/dehydratase family protein [unclassified Roseofilum]|uniref:NAD-dependent epimerase/dehydratase family protein n=1 Tax=unclassified Roseofilum TaxID=2620099 RepID=UPI000E93B117|nr:MULTISPECIES: NAD-dependent epimerase/dehydratase family protein [unclassified Roseofilum]MBP0010139.1 NAD-dependent epimerase/dehydratase family protein [Roseofilum sp. Belize Diploria]MBP0032055.1 NAD-dependent epimerase/dehydratase family protein [Roseofilum sp. Belize BBD 4]HBQ98610.1 hypothetical protein [Cyanobacteria bacterium UBA11691]